MQRPRPPSSWVQLRVTGLECPNEGVASAEGKGEIVEAGLLEGAEGLSEEKEGPEGGDITVCVGIK